MDLAPNRNSKIHFNEKGTTLADELAELVGVDEVEDAVEFHGQAEDQHEKVRDGQGEQVEVGGVVQEAVAQHHHAGAQVAEDAEQQDQPVDHRRGQHNGGLKQGPISGTNFENSQKSAKNEYLAFSIELNILFHLNVELLCHIFFSHFILGIWPIVDTLGNLRYFGQCCAFWQIKCIGSNQEVFGHRFRSEQLQTHLANSVTLNQLNI